MLPQSVPMSYRQRQRLSTPGAEYALKEKNGIVNAVVGFSENLEGAGEVIYNSKRIDLEEITKAVEPYEASIVRDEQATSIDLENLAK